MKETREERIERILAKVSASCKVPPRKPFREGDKVKIVRYSHDTNGKFGWITHINGGYIYVRLRWQPKGREIEVYDCEIEHA